ncbi:hypothetical protein ACVRY6_07295 [Streptococcus ictaluri]
MIEDITPSKKLPVLITQSIKMKPFFSSQSEVLTIGDRKILRGVVTSPLPSISGSNNLPSLGGTNITPLTGLEGGSSMLLARSSNSTSVSAPNSTLSGRGVANLTGISGESDLIEVTYNTSSNEEKTVSQENSVETSAPQAQPSQSEVKATELKVIDNKFDSYYKHEADRVMVEFSEMRNSLHFYDWDTRVEELKQKGQETYRELEAGLGNVKEMSQQALINATDYLNVLRTNLEKRKEELGRQEINKLNDAISDFNTAYNKLYGFADESRYAQYEEASSQGHAITQYLDRQLSEGTVDYTNVFAALNLKTELARLEGFTKTLTDLAQVNN